MKKFIIEALGGVLKGDIKEPSPLVIIDMVVDPVLLSKAVTDLVIPNSDPGENGSLCKPIVLQMCANVLPDVGIIRLLNISNGTDVRQFGDPAFIEHVKKMEGLAESEVSNG